MPNLTVNPSPITLLEAKKIVARTAGGQNDTDQQDMAGDCIREVIYNLNNIRDWLWLQNTTTFLNVTTASVTVPSRFKKIYSLTTSDRPLALLSKRDQSRQIPPTVTLGGTYFYTPFNMDISGVIELIDPPSVDSPLTSVRLDWLSLMDYPSNNASTFQTVPETAMAYVLASARAMYLAEKGGETDKLSFWSNKEKEAISVLVSENQRQLDEMATFQPEALVSWAAKTTAEWVD